MTIKVLGSSSAGNCYVLEDGGHRLILDAGVKLNDILRAIDYDTNTLCLITHSHRDHCESAEKLARRGLTVRSCAEAANAVPGVIEARPKVRVCGEHFDFIPFHVPHGETECYGYLVCTKDFRLLYATDYEYIPYNFQCMRLTHLLIECNYTDIEKLRGSEKYEHVAKGHSSLQTALGMVEANMTDALKFVMLCHVSASEDGEAMREKIQELVGENVTVVMARKGEHHEV